MLSDLVVIDLSSVLAGPSVATYFAELGAQVIKIEHPEHPDVTRSWKLPQEDESTSVSAYFSSINYGKKYIQLDLKKEIDYSQFIELIKKADILVTNFKKGDDIKLKIEDKDLLTYNPRLIHGKISGYGSESDRVAYDLILQAESGIMSMNGTPESGPVKIPIAVIDVLAAHHLKEAILLALYEREKTGQGKAINVSLYDAAVSSLVNQASNYLMVNHVPKRIGSLHPNIAPYGELFTTKDGETITFAIGSNLHFKKLCSTLQLDALIADEMYIDNQSRVINRVILAQQLQSRINKMNALELLNELQKMNVPAGKVKDLREVFSEKEAQNLVLEEVIDGVLTKRIKSVIFKGND